MTSSKGVEGTDGSQVAPRGKQACPLAALGAWAGWDPPLTPVLRCRVFPQAQVRQGSGTLWRPWFPSPGCQQQLRGAQGESGRGVLMTPVSCGIRCLGGPHSGTWEAGPLVRTHRAWASTAVPLAAAVPQSACSPHPVFFPPRARGLRGAGTSTQCHALPQSGF